MGDSGSVLYKARETEKGYGPNPDQDNPEVVRPYAAYSPAGNPQVQNYRLYTQSCRYTVGDTERGLSK